MFSYWVYSEKIFIATGVMQLNWA